MTLADAGTAVGAEEHTTVVADPPPPVSGPPKGRSQGRRWRRWIIVSVIGLIIAILIAGGIGFLVYGGTYRPLSWGDTSRVVSPSLETIGDGLDTTNLILVGPKGTPGTVAYALANNGPHPVKILGDSVHFATSPVVKLAWEPEMMDGAMSGGTMAQERPFPATIPAHSEIALWITVVQPVCSGSGYSITVEVGLDWSALGWHHSSVLELGPGPGDFLPIVNCPPKSAHVQHD
jgi:hypothetical protein